MNNLINRVSKYLVLYAQLTNFYIHCEKKNNEMIYISDKYKYNDIITEMDMCDLTNEEIWALKSATDIFDSLHDGKLPPSFLLT